MSNSERKFELGNLVATKSINDKMHKDPVFRAFVIASLGMHVRCDWGDLCDEDKLINEEALSSGQGRLFSSYTSKWGAKEKIWIITEWDRSTTTILFPEEY